MRVSLGRPRSKRRAAVLLPLAREERPPRDGDRREAEDLAERAVEEGIFSGRGGEIARLLPAEKNEPSVVLLGLGDPKKFGLESLRKAFGVLGREVSRQGLAELTLPLAGPARARIETLGWEAAARAMAEGWSLGGYVFDAYKSAAKKRADSRLVLDPAGLEPSAREKARQGIRVAEAVARGVRLARDLSNTPPNELYPETLASRARALARRAGIRAKVLGKAEIRRERMGAFLAVARGSARPPRLIVLEYAPRGRGGERRRGSRGARGLKTLVLIGKAVTFDSGGISLKPARGMEDMKYDMAGGAAVLGTMEAIAALEPRIRVVGLVPASENLISGSATRPGDIVRSASGKTVEVVNTDAEGRLLLADALQYARRYEPDAVVDIATLTGACVIALGTRVSGLMSNSPELAEAIRRASSSSGERVWELPLYDESFEAVKSKVADLKNVGGREGAAITAGAFLASFAEGLSWAHLDIAGTGWGHRAEGYTPAGATGVGVRLLTELSLSFGAPVVRSARARGGGAGRRKRPHAR